LCVVFDAFNSCHPNIMEQITERIFKFNSHSRPELASLKYKLMTENAFRFYRGTCHIFYEDLVNAPPLPESPVSWTCGDLHLENFGSYRGDNRLVYFDVNDFDESNKAPILWDVVRMTTSILLSFDLMNISSKKAFEAVRWYLKHFSDTLASGKPIYIEPKTASGLMKKFLQSAGQKKIKNTISDHTVNVKGKFTLKVIYKQLKLANSQKKALTANAAKWMEGIPYLRDKYKILDVCFRIAGTGSIGVERYVFLIQRVSDKSKYMLIDMKEARPSSVQPFNTIPQPQWNSEAERVITVQKMMQNVSPALLGENYFNGRTFIMQEMQPVKDRINFGLIENDFKKVEDILDSMAKISASTYLESSGRRGSATADELISFANTSGWKDDIFTFSLMFAQKTKNYFEAFRSDYKKGFK
jgi:uncharacterized protein (DUF2252 family)